MVLPFPPVRTTLNSSWGPRVNGVWKWNSKTQRETSWREMVRLRTRGLLLHPEGPVNSRRYPIVLRTVTHLHTSCDTRRVSDPSLLSLGTETLSIMSLGPRDLIKQTENKRTGSERTGASQTSCTRMGGHSSTSRNWTGRETLKSRDPDHYISIKTFMNGSRE